MNTHFACCAGGAPSRRGDDVGGGYTRGGGEGGVAIPFPRSEHVTHSTGALPPVGGGASLTPLEAMGDLHRGEGRGSGQPVLARANSPGEQVVHQLRRSGKKG